MATTSLVFMLMEVPAPPWKESVGNWSMQRPLSRISSQAAQMVSAMSPWIAWSSLFASAVAFFTWTMPRMNSGSSFMQPFEILKFSRARIVWIP